jgi:hypothetical protein
MARVSDSDLARIKSIFTEVSMHHGRCRSDQRRS